jgi:hypothetical protein
MHIDIFRAIESFLWAYFSRRIADFSPPKIVLYTRLDFSHSIDNVYEIYLNLHAGLSFLSDGMHSDWLVACFT